MDRESRQRKFLVLSAAIAAVACTGLAARAQHVIINDEFDDNDLTTNTAAGGVGAGWSPIGQNGGAVPIETGSAFHSDTTSAGNFSLQGISSRNGFDFYNAGGATVQWTTNNVTITADHTGSHAPFVGGASSDWRHELGIISGRRSGSDGASDQMFNNTAGGLYINLFYDQSGTISGNLRAINKSHPANTDGDGSAGLETVASFTFNGYDGVSDLITSLQVDNDSFSLSFDKDVTWQVRSLGGVTADDATDTLSGDLSLAFDDAAITDEFNNPFGNDAFVWGHGQNVATGRGAGDISKVTVTAAQLAESVTDTFASNATGNWSTGSDWSAGEASLAHNAVIDNNGTITIDQGGEVAYLLDMGSDRGLTAPTDDATGRGGTVNVEASGELTVHGGLRVGQAHNGSGTLNINGGTVTVTNANGYTARVGNQEFFGATGDLYVGDWGNGTMTMTGGTLTVADEIFLGLQSGSSGTLTMSGGTMNTSPTRNFLVGFGGANATLGFAGAHGALDLSGTATINTNFLFSSFNPGSTSVITQSGGTINANGAVVLARAGTSTYTHTGGAINVAATGNADFVVGDGGGSVGVYNIGGTASVTAPDEFIVGAFAGNANVAGANGTVNMTGGSITVGDEMFIARDSSATAGAGAVGTLNISDGTITVPNTLILGLHGNNAGSAAGTVTQSGGTITVGNASVGGGIFIGERGAGTYTMTGGTLAQVGGSLTQTTSVAQRDNLFIGRDGGGANIGTGTLDQQGGSVSLQNHMFLGDFDASLGTYKISGGSLSVGGNVNVGAALASNAPQDASRTGTAGQALDAKGHFIVSGSGATAIDIAGHFRANAGDKTRAGTANQSNLTFEVFDATGTTPINVAQNADLDGAVVNINAMGGYAPAAGQTFNLINATAFGATGTGTTNTTGTGSKVTLAAEDVGQYSLAVIPDSATSRHTLKAAAGTMEVANLRGGNAAVIAGTVKVQQNGTAAGASKVATLDIRAGAKLDLTDNKLITGTPAGTATGGVYTDGSVQRMVQTAYAEGAWSGNGLTTLMADAKSGLTTIAVATAGQLDITTFAGQSVAPTDTIAFYTYGGDSNFDGKIDADDYGSIDFNILVAGASGYANGDFNYDGVINADDYGSIDFNILAQGAPFSTSGSAAASGASLSGVTAVPEPASLSVLGLAAATLLGRRRRRP